jgi:hypothetical protein
MTREKYRSPSKVFCNATHLTQRKGETCYRGIYNFMRHIVKPEVSKGYDVNMIL